MIFLLFSTYAAAATEGEASAFMQSTPYDSLYRLLGSFVVVLLLMFVVAKLFKRLSPMSSQMNKQFKVVAVLPLGLKQKAALIQVGDEQILVGVSADNITALHKLNKPIEVEIHALDQSKQVSFLDQFNLNKKRFE